MATPNVSAKLDGSLRSLVQGLYAAHVAGIALIAASALFQAHPLLMYILAISGAVQVVGATVYWAFHRWKKEDEPMSFNSTGQSISYAGPSPLLPTVLAHAQHTLGMRGELPIADGEIERTVDHDSKNSAPTIRKYSDEERQQRQLESHTKLIEIQQQQIRQLQDAQRISPGLQRVEP